MLVYDCTKYIDSHPGKKFNRFQNLLFLGGEVILDGAGTDATGMALLNLH